MSNNKTYWVLTNENEIQNLIQYEDGLVEVKDEIFTNDLCTGIVFAFSDIFACISEHTRYIREIKIPDNANVSELQVTDTYGQTVTLYKTDRAIFEARRDFDIVTVSELIQRYKVNKDVCNSRVMSYFCDLGDVNSCKSLIKLGVRLDYPDIVQQPLLHAIKSKDYTLFKLIYKQMKDYTDRPNYIKDMMLHIVSDGTTKMLRFLVMKKCQFVKKSISFCECEVFQRRMIQQACMMGRLDMLKYLIDRLHVNVEAYYTESLEYAILCNDENIELIEYLLAKGVNIHSNDDRAFRHAVEKNRFRTVKRLVEAGANIHVYGNISLLIAQKNGFKEILEYLGGLDDYNRESISHIDKFNDIAYTL